MRQQTLNQDFFKSDIFINKHLPRFLTGCVGVCFILLALAQNLTADVTGERLVVVVTLVSIFVCVDLLAGRIEKGLWAGYLNLVMMTMWFSVGLLSAIALIIIGYLISTLLRLRGELFFGTLPLPRHIIIQLFFKRIALSGTSLLVASLFFYTLGGTSPVTDANFELIPTFLALVIALILSQVLGILMSHAVPKPPTIWAKGQRGRFINEILLLIAIPALSIVYHTQGIVVFVLLMGLVAAQAIRHWQIQRTQKSLIQRVEELSILNATAQSLSSSLEIAEVLQEVYRTLHQFSELPVFYVALYQETQNIFSFPLVLVNGHIDMWQPLAVEAHPALAFIIKKGKPLHITAPDNVHVLGHPCLSESYHAFLGLPLTVGNKMLGVLGIADNTIIRIAERVGAPTLNTIAKQMGLAIRNTNLYARTTQMALSLAQINQMTQTVALAPEQDDALKEACMTALKIAQADKVAIFLVNHHRQSVRLAWYIGLSSELVDLYKQATQKNTIVLVEEPTLIHDAQALASELDDTRFAIADDFRGMAKLPLKSSQNLLGMLVVYHQKPHYYHATEVDLLQTLANQLAVAYDNSELLRALELYGWEQAQLVYLSDISTSTLDVETIIINVTRLLQYSTESDWSDLVLAPQYQKEVAFSSIQPILPDKEVSNIPELNGLFGKKATTVIQFRNHAPALSSRLKTYMEDRLLQVLYATPLIVNNRVLGILLLGNYQDKPLTESQMRLCEMAANQVATQIQNALLYQRTQQALNRRMKQLGLIEALAQQISNALNKEKLIRNVLQAAINASGAELATLALRTSHNTLHIIQMELTDETWSDYETETSIGMGLVGNVVESGTPMIVANNLREAGYIQPYSDIHDDIRTFMSSAVVPLIQEEQVIGALNVESLQLDFFNEEHLEFFKNLAGHAVISIQNAILLEERQERIEAISASNNQLQAILNSTRDGVIFLDGSGTLIKANQSAQDLLNMPLNKHEGANFVTFMWEAYGLENNGDNLSLAQALHDMEHVLQIEPEMLTTVPFEIHHKDGQVRHIRMVGSPVRDSQDIIIGRLLTLHDITEERLLAKYRQNITRMMVHDLRGPLSSVISGISFATSMIDNYEADPLLPEVMNIALNNAQELLELVESLLDIYKLQAGQMNLNLVEADLAQIINAAHSALTLTMKEANIQFKQHIDPLLPHVYVDVNVVRRVLINLLDNAVRYSPEGGEVWVIAMPIGNRIEIRIIDSGKGIPASEQDRIFDEFHQVKENVPQRGSKGSGLGLTFCKLAIEAHHGTIHIALQSPLSGACFVLTLPTSLSELETQTTVITQSVEV